MYVHDNPHHTFLQARLPRWALHAQPAQWTALRDSLMPAPLQTDTFGNAAPHLREAVQCSWARLKRSQANLARALKGLQQIGEFAEPLLTAALRAQGFTAPLQGSELLRVESTWHWQGMSFINSHRRASLLQAALQNFADDETFGAQSAIARTENIAIKPRRVLGSVYNGDGGAASTLWLTSETYQVTSLPLAPATFAQLCRELDIGAAYQRHLQGYLSAPAVREGAQALLREQLRLAADLAYLHHRLSGAGHDCIHALIDGQATRCWSLTLFGLALHDATLIDAGDAGLLLHLPGAQTELLQYPDLAALCQALVALLCTPAGRQAFAAYLPSQQQAHFIDLLHQNLDAQGQSPDAQAWPIAPGADLHLTTTPIDGDPFTWLQARHAQRLKDQARLLAVPTADADAKASQRRLAQWQRYGLDALNLAGFFIPTVGAVMLGVAAWQLLGEVIEGVEAWSDGDRHLAVRHLEAVGLNLALMGGLVAAAHVVPKLFSSPLMDSLDVVVCTDNQSRLWQPDLSPYRSELALPDGVADVYQREDQQFLPLDGHVLAVRQAPEDGTWQVLHPHDAEAYQPPLAHTAEGAWYLPSAQPGAWTPERILRRWYPRHAVLEDNDLDTALSISGTSAQALREAFIAGQPRPPLLGDSLARLEILRTRGAAGLLADEALSDLTLDDASERLMARALEGLYFPQMANPDSERLWLACVSRLPGWQPGLRLEIRGASPEGPVLAATSADHAEQRLILIKTADGYEGYRGERPVAGRIHADPGQALLDALPAAQRQALAGASSDVEALRKAVLAIAKRDRAHWPRRLWGGTPRQLHKGLLRGGEPWAGDTPAFIRTAQARRYRRLYPTANEVDYWNQLHSWRQQGLSADVELSRLEARLHDLRRDLRAWAGEVPRRVRASDRLQAAWQRVTSPMIASNESLTALDLSALALEDHDLQSLVLPDAFDHIGELRLSHNSRLSALPSSLLARLPRLRRLLLSGCSFDHIPTVAQPARLEWLDLDRNALTWTPPAQATLEAMPNLGVLDLSDNPLIHAPSLHRLPGLRTVYLTRCQLRATPIGLETLREPLLLDFSENPLQQITNVQTIPANVASALSLESPTLGAHALAQADSYFQATGVDLLVPEVDYEDLLAGADEGQRALWGRLPLGFRRDLRGLLASTAYVDGQSWAREETWRRLARMDQDPLYRTRVLAQAADRLLELPLEYT